MSKENTLKVFISYSHLDETFAKELIKHLAPLKTNNLIQEWYDRKILAGFEYQEKIDNNFETADIICLLISSNFLSSSACMEEKNNAIEIHQKKGIPVVPIIISSCGWKDDMQLRHLLALPTDGQPITNYSQSDKAFHDIYEGLKKTVQFERNLNKAVNKKVFKGFLESADLLAKAHSQKETILLSDIFIYPTLIKYDDIGEYEKKESSEKLTEEFWDNPKMLVAGSGQSGKTTFAKQLFRDLLIKRFIPIYIDAKKTTTLENVENKILRLFEEQYEGIQFEEINISRLVPIVDDFQTVQNKEQYLRQLNRYKLQVIFVDDIFRMNLRDEKVIENFKKYRIKEFNPSLRYELIRKWSALTDKFNGEMHLANEFYRQIDQKTELVDHALGKVIGHGIMPAYPFFILSVISTYETFQIPLDQEITSQGYCYQALIYVYLRKQGVKNDDIDTYFNFLTEFSFYLFVNKKIELSTLDFQKFLNYYSSKYNMPIKVEFLLNKLIKAQIINLTSLGTYSFFYPYLYYYFVAKFLAEHCEEKSELINELIKNLHKDENAYIIIFMSHHSKKPTLLDEILYNALVLFEKFNPSKLCKEELGFFDEQIDEIVKEVLPSYVDSPEKKRAELLEIQDIHEELSPVEEQSQVENEEEDHFLIAKDLRRSIKTVEVMGQIIKNRAGSLEKERLEMIFEEAMNVHLRVMSSFLDLIQKKEGQDEIVSMISASLSKLVEQMEKKPSKEKLDKLSRTIFWNINFGIVYHFVEKIIRSLGSDKLLSITNNVCDKINTPASVLIKHGILMWYNKNLELDEISERIKKHDFAAISKKIMRFLVVNHASMHVIDYRDKQKIESKLGIPTQRLLLSSINKTGS